MFVYVFRFYGICVLFIDFFFYFMENDVGFVDFVECKVLNVLTLIELIFCFNDLAIGLLDFLT